MLNAEFYNLMMDTFGGLGSAVAAVRAQTTPPDSSSQTPLLQLRRGFAESPAWFLIQAAEFEGEPLSVAKLRVRDIYASESLVGALLELMASEGWLDRTKEGGEQVYDLTESGRVALEGLRSGFRQTAPTLQPLAVAELERLEHLLGRLIEASLASADPPGIWCLAHSRRRAPAEPAASLVKIAQYFADFNAFRDDAHMAAWQPHGIEGYVWEAFSFVWSGTANTAEILFEQLAHRGYSRSDYAAALQTLAQQGWLVAVTDDEPATYHLTEKGRLAREEVEQLTDHYFYRPWACLLEAEVAELRRLLVKLYHNLQQP